jgi:small subunit ribosomal protein S8
MGICILSTPKGILSDRQARKEHVGGELICSIW